MHFKNKQERARRFKMTCLASFALVAISLTAVACSKQTKGAQEPTSLGQAMNERLEAAVADEERRQQMRHLIRDLDVVMVDYVDSTFEFQKALAKLDANPEAEESDFFELQSQEAEARKVLTARYASLRIKMRQIVSEEEWKTLNESIQESEL